MLRAVLISAVFGVALAGCGASSPGALGGGDGGACVQVGQDAFCSASIPCCGGAWCDPTAGRCRDPNQCSISGVGCDADHLCCQGLQCHLNRCASPDVTGTTGGGTTAGGTTGSMCQVLGGGCAVPSDCCSGFCSAASQTCIEPSTGGNTSGGGGTTGSTCSGLPSGAGCSSGTQCCSGVCNGGICS